MKFPQSFNTTPKKKFFPKLALFDKHGILRFRLAKNIQNMDVAGSQTILVAHSAEGELP